MLVFSLGVGVSGFTRSTDRTCKRLACLQPLPVLVWNRVAVLGGLASFARVH